MTARIHLQFDRNQDARTEYYIVYRSTTPNITRRSLRVMKVQQVKTPSPIQTEETPVAIGPHTYRLAHKGILTTKPVTVYHRGGYLSPEEYTLDAKTGTLHLYQEAENDLVISYFFDGLEIVDDIDANPHLDVQYYGPPATYFGTSEPPYNVVINGSSDGTVLLNYELPANHGQLYYYAIEARNDSGEYSLLSSATQAELIQPIKELVIERSLDGIYWAEYAQTTNNNSYKDYQADREPPSPLNGVTHTVTKTNAGNEIELKWGLPLAENKSGLSPRYRMRTRYTNGTWSSPSHTVGPVSVKTPLAKVVIRKRMTSEPPTYQDTDNVQTHTETDLTVNSARYSQYDNDVSSYSLFVVDEAGNYSSAHTLTVRT